MVTPSVSRVVAKQVALYMSSKVRMLIREGLGLSSFNIDAKEEDYIQEWPARGVASMDDQGSILKWLGCEKHDGVQRDG